MELADGRTKSVSQLKRGDEVKTFQGKTKVRCLVHTTVEGVTQFVRMGRLLITPWHPVRIEEKWSFPNDLVNRSITRCEMKVDKVYNVVLDNHHTLYIDGTECVTLGHNFSGEVVAHPYFGSRRVIEDLQRMPGWEEGRVVINRVVREDSNSREGEVRERRVVRLE